MNPNLYSHRVSLTNIITKPFTIRNVAVDIMVLTGIYFVPALSHLVPFPLFLLDPMRIFMLAGFLLSKQNANAYLLAFSIPIFSALVTGHPSIFKSVVISIELMVNIMIFVQFVNRTKLHMALSMFLSIVGSKLIYYAIKFAFINLGYIQGDLITTNLYLQIVSVIFVSLGFYFTSLIFELGSRYQKVGRKA